MYYIKVICYIKIIYDRRSSRSTLSKAFLVCLALEIMFDLFMACYGERKNQTPNLEFVSSII